MLPLPHVTRLRACAIRRGPNSRSLANSSDHTKLLEINKGRRGGEIAPSVGSLRSGDRLDARSRQLGGSRANDRFWRVLPHSTLEVERSFVRQLIEFHIGVYPVVAIAAHDYDLTITGIQGDANVSEAERLYEVVSS